jgi:hypothetical protein
LVQLAKQFQGRRFLEIDHSETRIACGSHGWVTQVQWAAHWASSLNVLWKKK